MTSQGSEIDMALEEQRAEFNKSKDAGDFDEQFELAKVLAKRLTKRLAPIATEIHDSVERMLMRYYTDTRRKHYVPLHAISSCLAYTLSSLPKGLQGLISDIIS